MKRLASCLLLAVVLLGACTGTNRAKSFFIATLDSSDAPRNLQMRRDMQGVVDAAKVTGVVGRYLVLSAHDDPALQSQQLEQVVAEGAHAVLVNPVSSTGLSAAIDKAVRKGVIVMGIDRSVSHPRAYNFTTDQRAWARAHAEFILNALGGKGALLRFDGVDGVPMNEERAAEQDGVLAAAPGIRVLKVVHSNWDAARARQLMSQLLIAFPRFDAILSQGGGPGIYAALKDAKRRMPRAMSMDGTVEGVRLWYEHNKSHPADPLNACIVADPPGVGATGLQVVLWMLQGKRLKPDLLRQPFNILQVQPPLVITAETLEEWYGRLADRPMDEYLDASLDAAQVLDLYFQK